MKRLMLLLILLSIVIAAPVSAEEIRLTTIVPDQTIERAKKGAIGETYSNPATIPDGSIPTSGLLVEGNVGIGTTNPAAKLEVSGGSMRLAPTSQPASPQPGMIYYDSSTTPGIMKYWNGSAWVDMGGGGGGAFGTRVLHSFNYIRLASTDGIVVAYVRNTGGRKEIAGYIGSSSPPSEQVAKTTNPGSATGFSSSWACITFPVKKNDYWQVTCPPFTEFYGLDTSMVIWFPIGGVESGGGEPVPRS
ncbi:MAG: hypothetical protein A3I73_02075 [Omnitrophica bacterium RIFCSPLOWO2_02_FULL_45_16]|nr:MAG: hypothetical protein A3K16_05695 [Omnitrophica bacterium RIFCSPLOWO2_01_FULL_45_24]OGX01431.1 MAG: hypothetical protein A3I73_02075 [Omnitrophica bacterium RIFCSPLOWO2_02_FULL_45_16]